MCNRGEGIFSKILKKKFRLFRRETRKSFVFKGLRGKRFLKKRGKKEKIFRKRGEISSKKRAVFPQAHKKTPPESSKKPAGGRGQRNKNHPA